LGLTDFIADSLESYIELAVAKAADLESLSQLRASLRARMATSDFGDGPHYCRTVEAAYLKMWQRWCDEQSLRDCAQGQNVAPAGVPGFGDPPRI
jgi:predicted O-linked N-acetylglucosamine transferase (SPINDLY family)